MKNDKKKIADWIASIDGKTTFAGVINDYFNEISEDNYWRAENTRDHYKADYERRILPFITEHDTKPLENYTYEDYREIVYNIKETGKYSEARVLHLMRLISAVVRMAEKKYGYPNVLWGTAFEMPETLDVQEKLQELVTLKKSFSPQQEIALFQKLTETEGMSGERYGVLIMFGFGLRNGETAAIDFGDILESFVEDGFHALLVYKTIESKGHQLVSSGKTENADRVIPITDFVYRFLIRRKQYVAEQEGKSIEEINDYPVACVGNDYSKRCTPDQIARAAKVLFAEIGIKPRVLSYMDYEIIKGEDSVVVKEKDPTSYLMRRNFATQMLIIGMNEAEIQYLLGHDITDSYETRNEMLSFESLRHMGDKLKERAVFPHGNMLVETHDLEYSREYIYQDQRATYMDIPLEPDDELYINIESEELQGKPNVHIEHDADCIEKRSDYYREPRYKSDRTVNILNDYRKVYSKYLKSSKRN